MSYPPGRIDLPWAIVMGILVRVGSSILLPLSLLFSITLFLALPVNLFDTTTRIIITVITAEILITTTAHWTHDSNCHK